MALIFNELPTAFVWYDKKEKQQRYRENADKATAYKLICPAGRLLPFQFKVNNYFSEHPTAWEIYRACDDVLIANMTGYISSVQGIRMQVALYATYTGGDLQFTMADGGASVEELPEDCYYSVLTFPSAVKYYSEVFMMVADLSKYIKIEFWNSCDIDPIVYNNTMFKQLVYLDTFIHASEPEIEEDGERDGNDQIIPTFQKLVVKYRFSVVVPDFMKIAIISMQMHDNILLTTEKGIRTGTIEKMTTTSTIEASGAYSTVDVLLEQLLVSKDACCEEMVVTNLTPWTYE